MTIYTVEGNDIANMPQGRALAMIVAELRVISILLHGIATGGTSVENELDDIRSDVYIEPVLEEKTIISQ